MKVKIPWKMWYGNKNLELTFPDAWKVHVTCMKDAADIGKEGIEKSLSFPCATQDIKELARGKKKVAIAVDDLTRPTPAYRLLPPLLNKLMEAGVRKENITIIIAVGAHRPLTRKNLIKKVGRKVVNEIPIYNHCPYENLEYLGQTLRGTPIYVNKTFFEADLKIGVGFIMPHALAGFGGGAKIVVPGLAGIQTLEYNHRPAFSGITGKILNVKSNQMRSEIEEIAQKIGLDLVVNVVGTSRGGIAGVFVGDMVKAHRTGVKFARNVYSTKSVLSHVDIVVLNAYPCDTEFSTCLKTFNLIREEKNILVKKKATIVVATASPEGAGFHSLIDKGARLHKTADQIPRINKFLQEKRLFVFCPTITFSQVYDRFPKQTFLFRNWSDLIVELSKIYKHKNSVEVAIFPWAPLQILS